MRQILILLISILISGCTKDSTKVISEIQGKIMNDGRQTFYYKNNKVEYIENKGYGADLIKFFYQGDDISKVELWFFGNLNYSIYFEYQNNKISKIIDSAFDIYPKEIYYYKTTNYNYLDSNIIEVIQNTFTDRPLYKEQTKFYKLTIKNKNLVSIQKGNNIDSFIYDNTINPRFNILGFNKILDFEFNDYIGIDWVRQNSKNNITKELFRTISSSDYRVDAEYRNTYYSNNKLERVDEIDNGRIVYEHLNYKYFE
jgi:hypothetical protein